MFQVPDIREQAAGLRRDMTHPEVSFAVSALSVLIAFTLLLRRRIKRG